MYLQFSRNINNEFEEAIDRGVVALLIYVRSQIRISLYRHSDPFPPKVLRPTLQPTYHSNTARFTLTCGWAGAGNQSIESG